MRAPDRAHKTPIVRAWPTWERRRRRPLAAFEQADSWPALSRGEALFDAVAGVNLPIAGFVEAARALGRAHTVELNLEPSDGHSLFEERVYGPAGEIVPRFVETLLAR